jgi:large subunit ribosomal protein L29
MKASEIRGRTVEDVQALLAELQRRLFDLNIVGQTEENADAHERTKIRRDIARCKTILRQKALAGKGGSA